jgi:hypothetical protein
MSVSLDGFNPMAPENQGSRNVLPKGAYRCVLVDAQRKATSDGSGAYLNCEFAILDGEFQNQRIFTKLNLWLHPSKEMAIKIAKGQLSELCRAVNCLTPKDTTELYNKPVMVRVTIKSDDEYGDQNNVTGFKACQVHSTAQTQPAQSAQSHHTLVPQSANQPGTVW